MARKHSYKDLFMGALVGGTLGAITTLLFSTEGGKHLQKQFKQSINGLNLRHNLPKMATLRTMKNKLHRKIKSVLRGKQHSKKAHPKKAA